MFERFEGHGRRPGPPRLPGGRNRALERCHRAGPAPDSDPLSSLSLPLGALNCLKP